MRLALTGAPLALLSIVVAALNGIAILMADDDVDTLEVLGEFVAHEGATVRIAGSGQEALEILRTWKPDVVLLDIEMPDMDGCELLTLIHRQPALHDVLAVAVTGYDDASDRMRCDDAGFAGHVTKPFDVDKLIQLVATLVPHTHAT
jgi:two-component system, chemotaxis family, CheB/CheR fusion protein